MTASAGLFRNGEQETECLNGWNHRLSPQVRRRMRRNRMITIVVAGTNVARQMQRSVPSNDGNRWSAAVRRRSSAGDRRVRKKAQAAFSFLALLTGGVVAGETAPDAAVNRQSLDDAWWTGPILAASAATLPRGHFLIEPYVYDVVSYGRYDGNGDQHDTAHVDSFGSLTYLLYGLTDQLTVGLIPRFGFHDVSHGNDSSGVGLGDITLQAQYRLTQFREGGRMPTTSLVLQETLPTGKYDRLGTRTSDGFGSGAYTTTVAVYSQYYFWLPTERILRTRLNVSWSFSDDASVADVSVYGTQPGFRGQARPGDSFTVNLSGEYSVTRNWVLALDVFYQHDDNTRVSGYITDDAQQQVNVQENSGASWRLGFAPAIEYNFSSSVGVIVGARWIAAGRNADATLTPVAAINLVY